MKIDPCRHTRPCSGIDLYPHLIQEAGMGIFPNREQENEDGDRDISLSKEAGTETG